MSSSCAPTTSRRTRRNTPSSLRGIYRAIDDYMERPPTTHLRYLAPEYGVPDEEMKEALGRGENNTTYEDTVAYMPDDEDGTLREVFDAFNEINISLRSAGRTATLFALYRRLVLDGLFDGPTR